jgi:hypothetical protein
MESSAPAGQAGPDLFFAWKLAMNIDVRAFPADYEQAAQEALSDHPRPVWASGRSPAAPGPSWKANRVRTTWSGSH